MTKTRKPTRLQNYDYSQNGFYFVTICTYERICLFGKINKGDVRVAPCGNPNTDIQTDPCAGPKIKLNNLGMMVKKIWDEIPNYYPRVKIDEFVIMPNHIHGIIVLKGQPQGAARTLSLPDIIHRFKSLTTAKYRIGNKNEDWVAYSGKLWQRSFHDHIIRSEIDLNKIRQYIKNNPLKK